MQPTAASKVRDAAKEAGLGGQGSAGGSPRYSLRASISESKMKNIRDKMNMATSPHVEGVTSKLASSIDAVSRGAASGLDQARNATEGMLSSMPEQASTASSKVKDTFTEARTKSSL